MSGLVFPSNLPGVQMDVSREPVHDTKVQTTLSGKELRTTWSTYPRYRYALSFELLRSGASLREFQQFFTMLSRHGGMLDSFLFDDPEDRAVTDMGFAVGDGVAAGFQLQRTLRGDFGDAAGFTYQQQSKPYTNELWNSSFETSTGGVADSYTVYNNTPGTEPATGTIVPGMNGGKAQRVSWGTPNTSTKGLFQAAPVGAYVPGQWYTRSVWARAQGNTVGWFLGMRFNNPQPDQLIVISNPALSGLWQRYVFQLFWNPGQATLAQTHLTIARDAGSLTNQITADNSYGDLDFDFDQLVKGQHGVTGFQPFATPAAATARRDPAYWPALGDGFEPIYDLRDPPTIYQDGDWGFGSGPGKRQLYPFARTNIAEFSEQLDNAAWAKANASIVANATMAPDGTATADQFNEGTTAAVIHYVADPLAIADAQGQLRCYSVFVKANTLPNIFFVVTDDGSGIKFNLGTGAVDGTQGGAIIAASGVITDPRWPGWYRIWFVRRTPVTLATAMALQGCLDGTYAVTYTGTSRTFFAWGAMCERVSNLLGPTPYIATPSSAAVTVTDYSVDSLGKVTLPAALPAGAFLSWDGTYYRRCRFDTDSVPADRIVLTFWKTGRLNLLSVKP